MNKPTKEDSKLVKLIKLVMSRNDDECQSFNQTYFKQDISSYIENKSKIIHFMCHYINKNIKKEL